MTVQELIDMVKYGEMRNLKLGETEDKALVSYINLGLIELYKRFTLSTKETIIRLGVSGSNEYTLPNDCMWLITAFGEVPTNSRLDTMSELSINDENDLFSINTVGWNKVQVPFSLKGDYISLIYAAAPDASQKVQHDKEGLYLLKELQLPTQLVEALLFYIGYRAHGAMDGSVEADSNTHYMRFEASCKKVKQDGMLTGDNVGTPNRVQERGFI